MSLFLSLIFGAIGSGYMLYAKRTYAASYAIAGGLLILFPYFVSSAILTLLIGAAIAAAPFLIARYAN